MTREKRFKEAAVGKTRKGKKFEQNIKKNAMARGSEKGKKGRAIANSTAKIIREGERLHHMRWTGRRPAHRGQR